MSDELWIKKLQFDDSHLNVATVSMQGFMIKCFFLHNFSETQFLRSWTGNFEREGASKNY